MFIFVLIACEGGTSEPSEQTFRCSSHNDEHLTLRVENGEVIRLSFQETFRDAFEPGADIDQTVKQVEEFFEEQFENYSSSIQVTAHTAGHLNDLTITIATEAAALSLLMIDPIDVNDFSLENIIDVVEMDGRVCIVQED